MKTRLKYLLSAVFWVMLTTAHASNKTGIEGIQALPPGEQYRQLSLITLIAGGADPALIDSLSPPGSEDGNTTISDFNPDDYKTPLIRIVDQQSMLSGAAFLLHFAQDSKDEIHARLAAINAANPVLISMVDMNAITEDAIIIRNAIADAISFSSLAGNEDVAHHLDDYQVYTIRIRNIMEFDLFDKELEKLTDEAILSVGGKLDAYQRMFDEEVETKEFDRQFNAAEYIYNRTEKFDKKAGKLTEDIMKSVILSQSRPNS